MVQGRSGVDRSMKGGRRDSEWERGVKHLGRGEVRTVDNKGKEEMGRREGEERREGGKEMD